MSKLVLKKLNESTTEVKTVIAGDIPLGEVFTGRIKHEGIYRIFLRVYEYIIDLQDTKNTWNQLARLEIYDYKPVKKAELNVEY